MPRPRLPGPAVIASCPLVVALLIGCSAAPREALEKDDEALEPALVERGIPEERETRGGRSSRQAAPPREVGSAEAERQADAPTSLSEAGEPAAGPVKAPPASRPGSGAAPRRSSPLPGSSPRGAAPATAGAAPAPQAGASRAAPREPAPAAKGRREIETVLKDLQDPERADRAFIRLWEAPEEILPALVEEVENPTMTRVERIKILILDPDFVEHSKAFLITRLRGMGLMEEVEDVGGGDLRVISQKYTRAACGIQGKHYKVEMVKYGGFPAGVVIRAALINRLKAREYPPGSDDDPRPGALTAWWRECYGLWRASQEAETGSRRTR